MFRLTSRFKLHTINELLGLTGLSSEVELMELLTNKDRYFRPVQIKNKRWDETFKKVREGWVPMARMRHAHNRIAGLLLRDLQSQLPSRVMGGRQGYSTKKMAQLHCNQAAVLKLDIENCFDSISTKMVKGMLWKSLNNNCLESIVSILAESLTFNNKLPQGAPGSTAICNCVLLPLFNAIEEYCNAHQLVVSSWVDDFVISGPKNEVIKAIPTVSYLFKQHGLKVSEKKTKIYKRGEFGEVVGLTLGRRPTYSKPKRELLRKQVINAANGDRTVSLARLKGKSQTIRNFHPGYAKRLNKLKMQAVQKLKEKA